MEFYRARLAWSFARLNCCGLPFDRSSSAGALNWLRNGMPEIVVAFAWVHST